MKTIEFVGVPGVGKTTSLKSILKLEREDLVSLKYLKHGPIDFRKPKADELLNWKHFNAVVNNAFRCATSPDTKTYKRHMHRAVKRVSRARLAAGDKVFLMDGGLGQRGLTLALAYPKNSNLIDDYFHLMPKPNGAIFFVANINTLKNRNRERFEKGCRWNFDWCVEYLTAITKKGNIILKTRNVPVLEVCTENDLEYNQELILDFIKRVK